jgi:hypothetical protein
MQAELAKLNQVNGQIKAAAAVTPLPAGPAGVPLPNIAITGDPNDGKSDPLIYQIVAGNDRFTLVFKKVGDAYLCTTEMPVGLVADLVQNNAQFIADMNAGTAIPNNPISAWNAASQIPPNQIPPITCPNPNDDWLDGIALALRQKLQKAGIMGVPSRFSPMQWITPAASQDVAGRVGCRLPTESEWRAAAAAAFDLDRKQDNRRGANFAALAYIANAANFNPFKKIDPEIHYDQVWFRDVPNGAMTFTDFRGNVSNWVVTGDGSYGRIGESTMVDDPLPAKDFDFKAPFTKNDRFADVGFRLAFDPAQPKTDTNSLIQNLPFLDFPN